jgi:hypothetical protein
MSVVSCHFHTYQKSFLKYVYCIFLNIFNTVAVLCTYEFQTPSLKHFSSCTVN